MAKNKGRIPPPAPAPTGGKIPAVKDDPGKANIVFSFRFFDEQTDDFALQQCADKDQYLDVLIGRLRDVGTMTLHEFESNKSKAIRSGKINWDNASHDCFHRVPRAYQVDAMNQAREFNLSVNEHGRVHGFLIGSTFYVVWLDPEHKLFP